MCRRPHAPGGGACSGLHTRASSLLAAILTLSGCTVVNPVSVPSDRDGQTTFVSAGDIAEPSERLAIIQATRSGVRLFGFIDRVGTDLRAGFHDVLLPKIRELGGDGAINVRFQQTQYPPWAQVLGVVFFFVPLPTQVVVSAEVVRLRR